MLSRLKLFSTTEFADIVVNKLNNILIRLAAALNV